MTARAVEAPAATKGIFNSEQACLVFLTSILKKVELKGGFTLRIPYAEDRAVEAGFTPEVTREVLRKYFVPVNGCNGDKTFSRSVSEGEVERLIAIANKGKKPHPPIMEVSAGRLRDILKLVKRA